MAWVGGRGVSSRFRVDSDGELRRFRSDDVEPCGGPASGTFSRLGVSWSLYWSRTRISAWVPRADGRAIRHDAFGARPEVRLYPELHAASHVRREDRLYVRDGDYEGVEEAVRRRNSCASENVLLGEQAGRGIV